MATRALGTGGPQVAAVGLGCMGMSEFYGPADDAVSLAVLDRAIELGTTFWDTSDAYGIGRNEELIAKALRGRREKVFLATKFGIVREGVGQWRSVCGRPEYVLAACEASLRRLGVSHIDLYYQHRVDDTVPIEDTVGAMAKLVEQGKVRHIGLSEAAPATVRRAHAVHPIAAHQIEYSLWSRDPEAEQLPLCRELGIALVAYSPLGRGFLSGGIKSLDDLAPDDWRRTNPRFQGENFARNLALADKVAAIAARKGCTASQLALAWLLQADPLVIPIPGTRSAARLADNAGAAAVTLTPAEVAEIEAAFPYGAAAGTRYNEAGMRSLNK